MQHLFKEDKSSKEDKSCSIPVLGRPVVTSLPESLERGGVGGGLIPS